ncbi:MAG: SEC-C domain-containing protein [Cyanobacteriota bacterium]
MLVEDKINKINDIITNLIEYIEKGNLQSRFESFIKEEVTDEINSAEKYLEVLYAFIFDHKIDGKNTPLETYISETENISSENREILTRWTTSIHSIFIVNKVTKDAFQVENLVNEKEYCIKTLSKFVNYKRVGAKNFIFCRILPYEDYHILLGNLITFPIAAKKEVLEMAAMVQLENPTEMFKDNSEKLAQIYERNAIKYQKFYDLFGSNQVYTSGEHLSDLITAFSAYYEFGEMEKSLIEGKIQKPEQFYFNKEIASTLQANKSLESYISNYASCHDVGIIIDEKEGLSILPYYATFSEIFANKNFKEIDGYKECIMFYLEDDTISPFPFVNAVTKYSVNSVNVFEDILDHPGFSIQEDFDELMEDYKYDYLYNNKLSPSTVYDNSTAFKELITIYEDMASEISGIPQDIGKIGRNEPCPCGSGLKFKKCCINKF